MYFLTWRFSKRLGHYSEMKAYEEGEWLWNESLLAQLWFWFRSLCLRWTLSSSIIFTLYLIWMDFFTYDPVTTFTRWFYIVEWKWPNVILGLGCPPSVYRILIIGGDWVMSLNRKSIRRRWAVSIFKWMPRAEQIQINTSAVSQIPHSSSSLLYTPISSFRSSFFAFLIPWVPILFYFPLFSL